MAEREEKITKDEKSPAELEFAAFDAVTKDFFPVGVSALVAGYAVTLAPLFAALHAERNLFLGKTFAQITVRFPDVEFLQQLLFWYTKDHDSKTMNENRKLREYADALEEVSDFMDFSLVAGSIVAPPRCQASTIIGQCNARPARGQSRCKFHHILVTTERDWELIKKRNCQIVRRRKCFVKIFSPFAQAAFLAFFREIWTISNLRPGPCA